MKSKLPRKSVKFQSNIGDGESPVSTFAPLVPPIKKSILVLPFHLLLNLYGMFYYGLTTDTYKTILKGFLNVFVLQVAYGYMYATVFVDGTVKKKKAGNDNVLLLVISASIIACLVSNVIFGLLILFGAPVSSHLRETYVLAYHLSMIIVQPLLVCYKLKYEEFMTLFKTEKIYRTIFSHPALSSAFFAIVGTWLGVIPIPLDWDRPWQQWPITLLCGGYIGAFLGTALALVVHL